MAQKPGFLKKPVSSQDWGTGTPNPHDPQAPACKGLGKNSQLFTKIPNQFANPDLRVRANQSFPPQPPKVEANWSYRGAAPGGLRGSCKPESSTGRTSEPLPVRLYGLLLGLFCFSHIFL